MMKKVIVVGGNGQLGRAMVSCFKSEYETISIDMSKNPESNENIVLEQMQDKNDCVKRVGRMLGEQKVDSVVCVAGGWTGGSITSPTIFQDMQHMFQVNTLSSVMAGALAAHYLKCQGLLVLTGAALPFQEPTPDMLGYSLSKAATHSLGTNLASCLTSATVVTILPPVIDTPSNRHNIPNADTSTWVNTSSLSGLVKMWADGNNQPNTGAFAIIKNQQGMAVPEFI